MQMIFSLGVTIPYRQASAVILSMRPQPLATTAALIAPALVPLSCVIVMLRLASSASSTPHV